VAQQVLAKDLGVEGEGSHNVIVPIKLRGKLGTITQTTASLK
jgi:hypothetical protein